MPSNMSDSGYFVTRTQNDLTEAEREHFGLAGQLALKVLGTWENMSRSLELEVGVRLHTVSVRRWIVDFTLPCRMAFALSKVVNETAGKDVVHAADFHPWLEAYL